MMGAPNMRRASDRYRESVARDRRMIRALLLAMVVSGAAAAGGVVYVWGLL